MDLSPDVVSLMRQRSAAQVWLMTSTTDGIESFDDVARLAGVEPLGRGWVDVEAGRAQRFLAGLLHKDLAATDYTFDAGIAVVGKSDCGLYWVADED